MNGTKKIKISSLCIILAAIFSGLTTEAFGQKVIKRTITSKILGQEREIGILLPSDYETNKEKKYPVIYMLDSTRTISTKLSDLIKNGTLPQLIMVGIRPDQKTRDIDLLPPYMHSDLTVEHSAYGNGDKFLEFFEKELIPEIKKTYRTSGVNALSGHSRGGVFVLYSLLAKPALFDARFAFSPAVWREDKLVVKKVAKFLRGKRNKSNSFFYTSLGSSEVEKMRSGFDELTKTFSNNKNSGLIVVHEYTPNADHQTNVELSASSAFTQWAEYLGVDK